MVKLFGWYLPPSPRGVAAIADGGSRRNEDDTGTNKKRVIKNKACDKISGPLPPP